jgi:SAM-dependent methyltransferase
MYVFPNAAPQAAARLRALAYVFDPGTVRQLQARGVADGWTCLEIGGGLGTITRWLADRVGPRGRVLTTDIDTRHLDAVQLPNVEVRQHDVVTDALPEAAFDLACARLVLQHVSNPEIALSQMISAVRPGGWLLVEDFEVLPGSHDTNDASLERISKTAAVMRLVTAAAGSNNQLGRSLLRRFRSAGLEDAGIEGRTFIWPGGSAGAAHTRLNYQQLRDPILATGQITEEEFEQDLSRLEDPDFELRSPILWTAWGRRPHR